MKRGRGKDSARMLNRIVTDVRQQEAPEVDFEAMERELLARVQDSPDTTAAGERSWWHRHWGWVVVPIAGASLLWVVGRATTQPFAPDAAVSETEREEPPERREGTQLEVGQRVTTGTRAMTIDHPALGRWTLQPASSGEIRELGETVVVQLQSGSLSAEIVPSKQPERFVVEVGGVRVAVHGTAFSVSREEDAVVVEVSEGVVAVGPQRGGEASLLEAPAKGRFWSTGERAGQAADASDGVRRMPATKQTKVPEVVRTEDTPQAEPAPPRAQELTFRDIERGLSEIESVLVRCLSEQTNTSEKVHLQLSTRAQLRVAPDGSIERYEFSPPLKPQLAACVQKDFAGLRFAPSIEGAHVIRDLEIRP